MNTPSNQTKIKTESAGSPAPANVPAEFPFTMAELHAAIGPTLTYVCGKSGGYTVQYETTKTPLASFVYGFRKGWREYCDNYHAGLTRKSHGHRPTFNDEVNKLNDEARSRWMLGDVPGNQQPAIVLTPEEIARILADRAKAAAA